jgi:hypothetical protein
LAAGDYKIVAVAPARPGAVRLKLQPMTHAGDGDALQLVVPQAAADQSRLATGQTVTVRLRPYGFEFTQGGGGQPFLLVLEDAWYRELQTQVVKL